VKNLMMRFHFSRFASETVLIFDALTRNRLSRFASETV